MKLLPKLRPPVLPKPFSWDEWRLNVTGKKVSCTECNDSYKSSCEYCSGSGQVDCCECGNEKDCDNCKGNGIVLCDSCKGEVSFSKYVDAIARDYLNLIQHRGIVMPIEEIELLAASAAWIKPISEKSKVAA